MRKYFLLTYFLLSFVYGHAELAVKLNVETPGSLSTMIASSKKSKITHLTLSGTINGSDILYIRNMAGAGIKETISSSKCSLQYLDIANVTIVEGGAVYSYEHTKYRGSDYYSEYHQYKTKDNTITSFMFDNCYKLKTLILPKTVTKIEADAFFDTNIQSITLPERLESLESSIPSWYITDIMIAETNQHFKVVDGVLYSYDMKTLYRCPTNYVNSIFQIPEGVEIIYNSAFNYCINIKGFNTPSTLKEFGYKSCGWLSLNKFVLEPNVRYYNIGDFTNIQEVIIPESFSEFDPSLFGYTTYDLAEWNSTKVNKIKVYSKTPPTLTDGFNRATLAGNLYVPQGSYSAYYIAYRWGDFAHIYEMAGTENGIAQMQANAVQIQTENGNINIMGVDDGIKVSVYGINGLKVGSAISCKGHADIVTNLSLGSIAIIKIGDKNIKVAIK